MVIRSSRGRRPNAIQQARFSAGLTQWDVVRKLERLGMAMSQSTYAFIELGRREATPKEREKLAKVFGVQVADLWPSSEREAVTS